MVKETNTMKRLFKPLTKLEKKNDEIQNFYPEIEGAKNATCYCGCVCPDQDSGWEAGWYGGRYEFYWNPE